MTRKTHTANGVFYEFNESGSVHVLNPQTLKRYRYEKNRFAKGLQTWGQTLYNIQKHVNPQEAYFEEYNDTEATFTNDEQAMDNLRDVFGACIEMRVCRIYREHEPAEDRRKHLRGFGLSGAIVDSPKGYALEAVFRQFGDGEAVAIFTGKDEGACFRTRGQLQTCPPYFAKELAKAKPEDVERLTKELEAVGYVVTNAEQEQETTFTLDGAVYLPNGLQYGGGEVYFSEGNDQTERGTLSAWLVSEGRGCPVLKDRKGAKVVLSPFAGKRGIITGQKITLTD